ncbi:MAG TPA: hypothetical protein VME43_19680 [Bryobacteraceae bacterium]|nr:hypothetical protein [Bryobacteraceae bacterium]
MSQVLGDEFFLLAAAVDLGLKTIKGGPERGIAGRAGRHDLSEFGAEQASICACEKQGKAQSSGGQLLAMAVWDPLNESVQTESAQGGSSLPVDLYGSNHLFKRSSLKSSNRATVVAVWVVGLS